MQGDQPPAPPGGAATPPPAAGKPPRRRSGPRSRSSPYKGVTQYRRTGKWEAHIWVPNPRGRGFQRHLGSYHTAEDAARCFDRATIRVRGAHEELNFPVEDYRDDPFMLEHAKTERFRFLDEIRRRFALQAGEGAGGGAAAAGGRRPPPPRRPAAMQVAQQHHQHQQQQPALPLFRGQAGGAAGAQDKGAARLAGHPVAEDLLLQTPGPFPPEQQFWTSPAAGPMSPAAAAARTPLSFAAALGCDPTLAALGGQLHAPGAAFPSSILGGGGGEAGPSWMGAALLTPVYAGALHLVGGDAMRQFLAVPGGGLPPAAPAVGPLGPLDPGHDDHLLDGILGAGQADGMESWFMGSPCS